METGASFDNRYNYDEHFGGAIANVTANVMGRRKISTFSDIIIGKTASESNESSNNNVEEDGEC